MRSRKHSFLRRVLLAVLCSGSIAFGSQALSRAADSLTIGSNAPQLDVEHWVQNGGGKFKPVTKFEKGNVYVVEFWATWCGPCVASMPHLAETQKKYADKKVQIVSISDEELETVEKFLDRDVPGAGKASEGAKEESKKQTFKELTSAYCLTTDPDASSYMDYMEAAEQKGIPTAFIVGKDGKIEWIGHPMEMDAPLAAVVADKWDRKTFAEEYKEKRDIENSRTEIILAMRKGDMAKALGLVSGLIEKVKSPSLKSELKLMQLQLQLSDADSKPKLGEILPAAYKEYADNPELINVLAWSIYEKFESGDLDDKALLKATRAAAEKAAAAVTSGGKAAILDTASHLQYLDGDLDAAIKTQTKAVEEADSSLKDQLDEFLQSLKKEKADGAKK